MDGVGQRSLTRLFRGTYGHWSFRHGLETSKNVLKAKGCGKTRSFQIVRYILASVEKEIFSSCNVGDDRYKSSENNFVKVKFCKEILTIPKKLERYNITRIVYT